MFRKRTFWIALVVLVLLGGGGAAYGYWLAPQEVPQGETTIETATVTVGDISITADGTGMLVPLSETKLAFDSSSTLLELLVEVGDVVQAGDLLAYIDDTDARNAVAEAELSMLQAEQALDEAKDTAQLEQAVSQAELTVTQTEADLATAQEALDELLNWAPDESEGQISQADLAIAQAGYQNTVTKAGLRDEQLASTRINLEQATRDLEDAQISYANAMDAARDWENNIEDTRVRAAESLQKAQDSLEIAQASYDLAMIDSSQIDVQNAWVKVLDAQQALEELQTPPDDEEIATARLAVQELEVALGQAQLDLSDAKAALANPDTAQAELTLQQAQLKLESALAALDGTTLVAPAAGTVTEIAANVGEKVSGTAIVLANMQEPVVQFWVEESDLNSVAVGNPVNIVFEALPDLTYEGKVLRVDPTLVQVSNTSAVQAWASIDTTGHLVALLGDMNVEVEIVSGEATNALLVPVTALRDAGAGDGEYAVFVVGTDGELELRPVEVGLKDYVNAEIVSGLQRGEVVSLGQATTSSSSSSSSSETGTPQMQPGGDMIPPFMGG
jgi:RND family efflux transporter MFP subunit